MVGCWDRTLHTMRGVVLLLIASISCATGMHARFTCRYSSSSTASNLSWPHGVGSSDTCEAQITPLYTSVSTWTDTATLLSAHNLRSNVTALSWIQNPGQDLTPRGGVPPTPLLAVGDGAGGVHILTAQGFVVASFTPGEWKLRSKRVRRDPAHVHASHTVALGAHPSSLPGDSISTREHSQAWLTPRSSQTTLQNLRQRQSPP